MFYLYFENVFNSAVNVLTTQQMSGRIVTSVLAAFVLFAVYSWYTTQTQQEEAFDINSQSYASAPLESPPPLIPERVVSSAGPGAPAQLSMKPPTVANEERPYDPQEKGYESAEIPERLRHPERMFGPGVDNQQGSEPIEGVASYSSQVTNDAHQTFGPEFAQNGGNFMGEVVANDTTLKTNYSSV
jgi:hypothetical protein